MGFLGGIFKSAGKLLGDVAGNVLGKFGSSAIDAHYSRELIEAQLQAQKDLFEFENSNKHQFEVNDLRAAGLNPILSATNGSAVSVGGVSAPNWSSDDDIYNSAASRMIQRKQLDIADQNAQSAAINATAQLTNAKSNEMLNSANANLANSQAQALHDRVGMEMLRLSQDIKESNSRINKMSNEVGLIVANTHLSEANKVEALARATGVDLDNNTKKVFKEIVNESPTVGRAIVLANKLPGISPAERVALVGAMTAGNTKVRHDKIDRDITDRMNQAQLDEGFSGD